MRSLAASAPYQVCRTMDCVGSPANIKTLLPRRPIGLKRPTRNVPGIGIAELVREGNASLWEVHRQIVPTRNTRVSGLLQDIDCEQSDEEFIANLSSIELDVRSRFAQAWSGSLLAASERSESNGAAVQNISKSIAPYHIERLLDGYEFSFDCTDTPGGNLMGATHVQIKTNWNYSIIELGVCGLEELVFLQAEMFRQRVIPSDCGFVQDSVADRFACLDCRPLNNELEELLLESIQQVRALRIEYTQNHHFLDALVSNLDRLHQFHREGEIESEDFDEP